MTTARAPRAENPPGGTGPRKWVNARDGYRLLRPRLLRDFGPPGPHSPWMADIGGLYWIPDDLDEVGYFAGAELHTRAALRDALVGPVAHDGQGAKRVVSSERDPP